MDKDKKKYIALAVIVILILIAFLVGFSFEPISYKEIALVHNNLTKKVFYDDKYTENGFYFIGVEKNFIRFPKILQSVEFTNTTIVGEGIDPDDIEAEGGGLSCFTQDGINVYIEMSFYYKLNPDRLLFFYREFGDDWKKLIAQMSSEFIKETSPEFISTQYFTDRNLIAERFKESLIEQYNDKTSKSVEVISFQLRKISFDQDFENAVVDKIVREQEKKKTDNQGKINITLAVTEQIRQNATNILTVTEAEAIAAGLKIDYGNKTEALLDYTDKISDYYNKLRNQLATTWDQVKLLMYAIELKTNKYINKRLTVFTQQLRRVIDQSKTMDKEGSPQEES